MAKVFSPVVCDISHHNTVTDFAATYAAGIRGIIHKATQGAAMVDKMCARRIVDAKKAGMLVGYYHFGDNSTVTTQVSNFLRNATEPDALLALDWEPNGARTMSVDQAKEFLRLVYEKTGQRPVLYSGNLLKEQVRKADPFLCKHRLWLAHYANAPKYPTGWDSHFLWQYAADGAGNLPHSVAGIKDIGVDLNVFGGSDLAAEWVCRGEPDVVPIKTATIKVDAPIASTSPADRPEIKTPTVVPPKNGFNIKDLMAYSRKAPLIVWGKRIGHTVWISLTTDKVMEYFGIAKDTRAQVETFFHDHAAVLAITGVITVILILRKLGIFVEDDVNSGRAKPSGLTPENAK